MRAGIIRDTGRWISAIQHFAAFSKLEKWVQVHAGNNPALFYFIFRLARKDAAQAVSQQTEIVIEGFPRSANSFAVGALRIAQGRHVRVASNLHVPAQIIRAVRWRIPTLVLIRRPEDAVPSLMIRDRISAHQALRYYIAFYAAVAHYRSDCILARFEEVTQDYGAVIERVNQKFGTHFILFRHTDENIKKVFFAIDAGYQSYDESSLENAVSRPVTARELMKREVARRLEKPSCKKLLAKAVALYERLTAGYS
jgi:hypothetical protein